MGAVYDNRTNKGFVVNNDDTSARIKKADDESADDAIRRALGNAALDMGDDDITSDGLGVAKTPLQAAQAIVDGTAPVPILEFELIE